MALQKYSRFYRRMAFASGLGWMITYSSASSGPIEARTDFRANGAVAMSQLGPQGARERIDALRAEIARHDDLYFKKSAPVISDSDYDRLKRELAALERAFPVPADEGPATGIGDDRLGGFPVGRHRVRMLGLDKSYTETELRAFDARLMKQLGQSGLEYVIEPKYDGLAISVTYENGKLLKAITRGNGSEGDDVTVNALAIRSLPRMLRIDASASARMNPVPELIELRGEVYLSFAEFARINREREDSGERPYSNPRNLAAGSLKQGDADQVANRRLEIVFYGLGACEPEKARPPAQSELLSQLREWGVPTIQPPPHAKGFEAMWQAVQAGWREREQLGFPIDGVVVKLNSVALQDRLGVAPEFPLWAMAYKFASERAETQLRAITLQVGRTGAVTPVAELAPVQLGGSTVARASLHNGDEIARRDIRVGDFVYVEKAGEIIPAIVGVNWARRALDSRPYQFPTLCPDCRSDLVRGEKAVVWRCVNETCPARIKRRVEHFASGACVTISGLGPAMVNKLVESGRVKNIADLYRLKRDDLLSLSGNGEKSSDRLLAAIEGSKRAELWRFIHGLGIPQVGAATARDLAHRFGGLAELSRATREDFFQGKRGAMPRIGESTIRSILVHFSQTENQAVVSSLLSLGVSPSVVLETKGKALAGKSFVLTGTLPILTRAQAIDKITAAGGIVASSITRKTDYLLAGERGGEKLAMARSLGVLTITEADLMAMLDGKQ